MPRFPIAIAQSHVERDVAVNGEHIRALMDDAREGGARLVHFPEGALSGYVKAQIESWVAVDWGRLDEEIAKVAAHARRLGLFVVVGANTRSQAGARPYNSLLVISDEGSVVARYDKRFCSHTEITDWYRAGREPCVFEIDGMRFGCCLCIEVHFPTVFAEYERLEVDCVLLSAYSDDPMFWVESRGHAACNNLWVSVATAAECGARLPSGLVGPDGSEIVRAPALARAQLIVSTLHQEAPEFEVALKKARPWRRKARARAIYADDG